MLGVMEQSSVCQLAKSRQQSLFNTRWCPSSLANLVPITPVSRVDEWGCSIELVNDVNGDEINQQTSLGAPPCRDHDDNLVKRYEPSG